MQLHVLWLIIHVYEALFDRSFKGVPPTCPLGSITHIVYAFNPGNNLGLTDSYKVQDLLMTRVMTTFRR